MQDKLRKSTRSGLSPWQAYQDIYPRFPVSIFLDSVTFQKPNQRYSLIGYDVKAELSLTENDLKRRAKSLADIQKFLKKKSWTCLRLFQL